MENKFLVGDYRFQGISKPLNEQNLIDQNNLDEIIAETEFQKRFEEESFEESQEESIQYLIEVDETDIQTISSDSCQPIEISSYESSEDNKSENGDEKIYEEIFKPFMVVADFHREMNDGGSNYTFSRFIEQTRVEDESNDADNEDSGNFEANSEVHDVEIKKPRFQSFSEKLLATEKRLDEMQIILDYLNNMSISEPEARSGYDMEGGGLVMESYPLSFPVDIETGECGMKSLVPIDDQDVISFESETIPPSRPLSELIYFDTDSEEEKDSEDNGYEDLSEDSLETALKSFEVVGEDGEFMPWIFKTKS